MICFYFFFFKIIEIKGAVFGKRIAYLVAVAGKEAFALCQNFLFLHPVARQKRIKVCKQGRSLTVVALVPEAGSIEKMLAADGLVFPATGILTDGFLQGL